MNPKNGFEVSLMHCFSSQRNNFDKKQTVGPALQRQGGGPRGARLKILIPKGETCRYLHQLLATSLAKMKCALTITAPALLAASTIFTASVSSRAG